MRLFSVITRPSHGIGILFECARRTRRRICWPGTIGRTARGTSLADEPAAQFACADRWMGRWWQNSCTACFAYVKGENHSIKGKWKGNFSLSKYNLYRSISQLVHHFDLVIWQRVVFCHQNFTIYRIRMDLKITVDDWPLYSKPLNCRLPSFDRPDVRV